MGTLRRNCPHCHTQRVAFEVKWSDRIPGQPAHVFNCAATCGSCLKPICFISMNNHPHNHNLPSAFKGDIEQAGVNGLVLLSEIWPMPQEPQAPPHTPPQVAKRFLEGEDAFNRKNWNSAVAMYRSTLDIATKAPAMDGIPAGRFFDRLKWLAENQRITPDMRDWADHVRVEGNGVLHDEDDYNEVDATALRLFTEMFLRYAFELREAVKLFRAKTEKAD